MKNRFPLIMTEEYWMNSQFSIARFYGGINLDGREYIIVDKLGRDLLECSRIAEKLGKDKAIEAGEPADLILKELQSEYKILGRLKFIDLVTQGLTVTQIKSKAKKIKSSNK